MATVNFEIFQVACEKLYVLAMHRARVRSEGVHRAGREYLDGSTRAV